MPLICNKISSCDIAYTVLSCINILFACYKTKKKQKQKKVQRTMHNILYIDVISTAMTHNAMLLSNLLLMKNENYMRV